VVQVAGSTEIGQGAEEVVTKPPATHKPQSWFPGLAKEGFRCCKTRSRLASFRNCSRCAPRTRGLRRVMLAEAFDECMSPAEWSAFTGHGAEPRLRAGCLQIWQTYVLPRFEARYGVRVK
jgi:hypothetical protein